MPKRYFIVFVVVAIVTMSGWFVVSAQTWIMSPSPPPDNTTLQTPSAAIGDQLGHNDPHQARLPLFLSPDDTPRFRLYNIRSTFEGGVYYPALYINGHDRIGLSLSADQSYGLRAVTNSNNAAFAGLRATNTGGGPALLATSTSGYGAKLFGGVKAEKGYILGNSLANQLQLSVPGSDSATASLYWGNTMVCDASSPTCGWVPDGARGDGLGNHKATKTLNMNSHQINNVQSSSMLFGSAALMANANAATTTIDAQADDGYGVFAASDGLDANNSTGLYASTTQDAPAISAGSWLGRGLTASSPVQILNDVASGVSAAIQFGEQAFDYLGLTPKSGVASQNLYWGDKLLCDVSKVNCGWSTIVGNASFWLDNAFGINNPNSGVGKVLLGRAASSFDLDVGHGFFTPSSGVGEDGLQYNVTGAPISGIATAAYDAVVRGKLVYAMSDRLRIFDASIPSRTKLLCIAGSPTCSSPLLGATGWGLDLSGSYAYLATSAGLKVMDISKPRNVSFVGSGLAISGISAVDTSPTDVRVRGSYAYVVADTDSHSTSKLLIVNIADPANLQIVRTVSGLQQPRQVLIQGNTLVVVDKDRNSGLTFYSLTDPAYPSFIGRWQPPAGEYVSAAAISGSTIYAAGTRLYAIDLTTFSLLGSSSVAFTTTPSSLVAQSGYVLVGAHINYTFEGSPYTSNVTMYDVNDPAAIRFMNDAVDPFFTNNAASTPSALAMDGSNLFIFDRDPINQNLKVFSFQGARFPATRLTQASVEKLTIAQVAQVGSLTATSASIGTRLNIGGILSVGTQGIILAGTVLDETTLSGLKTKANVTP